MPSRKLETFHDAAMPLHTHRHCKNCLGFQRCGRELSRCGGCNVNYYCSLECQKEHWTYHKDECKGFQADKEAVLAATGSVQPWLDFVDFAENYHAPLINCTVASMKLRDNPKAWTKQFLGVEIIYCGQPGNPMEMRFCIKSVEKIHCDDHPPRHVKEDDLRLAKSVRETQSFSEKMGRLGIAEEYHGMGTYTLICHFPGTGTEVPVAWSRSFVISKTVAKAKSNPRWLRLLAEYVLLGKKINFRCAAVDPERGMCCCGAQTHEKELCKGGFCPSVALMTTRLAK